LRKNKYVSLIESFISEAPSDEAEHGIVENNNISLNGMDQHPVNIR